MAHHIRDPDPALHVPVEHQADQVDTLLAHDKGHAQVLVHDLIDAVEGVFLVDDGVEEDAERPDVLFAAVVGLAGEDFGSGVVCG